MIFRVGAQSQAAVRQRGGGIPWILSRSLPLLWREYAEQIYRLTPGRPCLAWHNGLVKSHFVPGDNKVPSRRAGRARAREREGFSRKVLGWYSFVPCFAVLSTGEAAKACQPSSSSSPLTLPLQSPRSRPREHPVCRRRRSRPFHPLPPSAASRYSALRNAPRFIAE